MRYVAHIGDPSEQEAGRRGMGGLRLAGARYRAGAGKVHSRESRHGLGTGMGWLGDSGHGQG